MCLVNLRSSPILMLIFCLYEYMHIDNLSPTCVPLNSISRMVWISWQTSQNKFSAGIKIRKQFTILLEYFSSKIYRKLLYIQAKILNFANGEKFLKPSIEQKVKYIFFLICLKNKKKNFCGEIFESLVVTKGLTKNNSRLVNITLWLRKQKSFTLHHVTYSFNVLC